MKLLINQIKIETKLFFRYKETVFWSFAFPVFFMVLFGLLGFGGDRVKYINFLLPGMIVMALMTTCIISTAVDIVSDRSKGIFRRLFVTPLSKPILLGGKIINRYIIVLLQTILLIVVAVVFFGARISGNYLLFWLVLTVGMLSFLGIGFVIASFVRRTESVHPISMIAFFLLMFLGETFWPTQMMPKFLQPVTKVLPTTYLNRALREVSIEAAGIEAIWLNLLIPIGWLIVCFVLSIRFFRWE